MSFISKIARLFKLLDSKDVLHEVESESNTIIYNGISLFSIPSIDDRLPTISNDKLDDNNLELLEHEWRQVEFVSVHLASDIEDEFQRIRASSNANRVTSDGFMDGYTSQYKRKLIANTILLPIGIETINKYFSNISFGSISIFLLGKVDKGVGLFSPETKFYGLSDDNKLTMLGFKNYSRPEDSSGFIAELKYFMKNEKLYLVDWCKMKIISEGNIDEYLKQIP